MALAVRPHGYHVMVSYFEEDPALEAEEAASLLARQVDGMILASVQQSGRADLFEQIRARKVPYVLIDRPIPGLNASFVGADNRAIGKLATEPSVRTNRRQANAASEDDPYSAPVSDSSVHT